MKPLSDRIRDHLNLDAKRKIKTSKLSADFDFGEKDDHAFRARISTNALDRDREVMLPQGMDASEFDKSGAIFWNHDYDKPIGFPTDMKQGENHIIGGAKFMKRPENFKGEFFPDFVRAFVQQAKELGRGIGVSVGFEVISSRRPSGKDKNVYGQDLLEVIDRWKLLEWSIAPVQANQEAMTLALQKGLLKPECLKALFPEIKISDNKTRKIYIIPVSVGRKVKEYDISKTVETVIAKRMGKLYL